jgi:HEAT repeat protein
MKGWGIFLKGMLAVLLTAATLPAQQAPPSEIQLLKSSDASTRAKAARDLGKSGDLSALHPLAAAVTDPSDKVRREVVVALASFHNPEALDPLIVATRDTDPDIRVLAVRGLVGYYTGRTLALGFVGFWKRTWRKAKNRFAEESVRIDPGVKVDPKVVTALAATLNDTRALEAARQAADGLGILMAQSAVPDLVKAAHSADDDLAVEALNALSKIKDVSAGPQLVDLLDSADEEVKQQAAVTVGILRTEQALPKLQAMYSNNPDAKTRAKALEGIAYLGAPASVPLLLRVLWSSDSTSRTLAAEGLARAHDAQALSDLEKAIQVEKNADARLAIEFALTALGKNDYLSQLIGELGSKTRGDTVRSYLVELARNPQFLHGLYPYLQNRDAGVRKQLCLVLMFSGDSSSIAPLERASHDSNAAVAAAALRALRAVRARTTA